jgi:AcrR family transcriptional regulator
MSTRRYDSTRRQQAAARTRIEILDAGRQLFISRGYAATTMSDVAARAGVAPATAAAAFGGKAGLLKRLVDVGVAGDDEDVPVSEREVAQRIAATTDAVQQCEMLAAFVTDVHERLAPLHDVLMQASGIDDDVRQELAREQERRRAGMAEFSALVDAGALKPELDGERAADVAWALTEPRLYVGLVQERGWTKKQYRLWLGAQLVAGLLR